MKKINRIKKKSYAKPQLTVHGTVAEITKVLGDSNASDTLIIGGISFGALPTTGSQDFSWP